MQGSDQGHECPVDRSEAKTDTSELDAWASSVPQARPNRNKKGSKGRVTADTDLVTDRSPDRTSWIQSPDVKLHSISGGIVDTELKITYTALVHKSIHRLRPRHLWSMRSHPHVADK